ncbi:hypothetical protein [Pseudomonas sp. TE3610]
MQEREFALVRIDKIHEIVSPIIEGRLHALGFEAQAPLHWLRSTDAPIRQIFCLRQWKGGALAPAWGLSLDFVPHVSGSNVKWHKTFKSAQLDLTWDARNKAWNIPYCYGPEIIETKAHEVLSAAIAEAELFWEKAQLIADLPSAFERVKQRLSSGGLGFYNYVQHPLAYAFVLALNGSQQAAEEEFQRYYSCTPEPVRQKLQTLLTQAGQARLS